MCKTFSRILPFVRAVKGSRRIGGHFPAGKMPAVFLPQGKSFKGPKGPGAFPAGASPSRSCALPAGAACRKFRRGGTAR
ncbi:MAG: hypothetical protein C6P37_08900 [Caldibacillus debilis]|uniref:Uncharacterized protein n=1 Tax=Caldibacillus debilis TaxID=301148 RepID=A0A3E0K458_9BACI|nr:MAG: hypothetical protein BAA03_06625 [Caldibacillus debilis]REJ17243.1 MAG: hypothetical protein C6W57_06675 [Caldibacillus debilis]REJ28341.1 MAG: hypothetical protein C6P37_08900 [Caldibacillus debilis]